MANNTGFVKISIKFNGADKPAKIIRAVESAVPLVVKAIALEGERKMKQLAQPAGGRHQSSIQAQQMGPYKWRISATGRSEEYTEYLNRGTDPSRGRYIPSLEKRYSKKFMAANPSRDLGVHPGNKRRFGSKGLQFVEGTTNYLEAGAAQRIGDYVINRAIKQAGG